MLCKHLHATDLRVSVSAATQIPDRAYGGQCSRSDVSEDRPTVRYFAEMPEKSATTEEWLESIRREDAGRALVTGVAAAAMTSRRTRRMMGPILTRPPHPFVGRNRAPSPAPSSCDDTPRYLRLQYRCLHAFGVPSRPPGGIERGKVPVPRRLPFTVMDWLPTHPPSKPRLTLRYLRLQYRCMLLGSHPGLPGGLSVGRYRYLDGSHSR